MEQIQEQQERLTTGRNSSLREIGTDPLRRLAEGLYDNFGITANGATALSTAVVIGNSILAAKYAPNSRRFVRVGFGSAHGGLSLGDKLDGNGADYMDELGVPRDKDLGAIVDPLGDRAQEAVAGVSRAIIAFREGRKLGGVLALTTVMTGTLPSIYRARAESQGIFLPEGGLLSGNRVTRATGASLGLGFPEAQPALDLYMTIQNARMANRRRKASKDPSLAITKEDTESLSEDDREKLEREIRVAPRKEKILRRVNIAANAAVIATAVIVPYICAKSR